MRDLQGFEFHSRVVDSVRLITAKLQPLKTPTTAPPPPLYTAAMGTLPLSSASGAGSLTAVFLLFPETLVCKTATPTSVRATCSRMTGCFEHPSQLLMKKDTTGIPPEYRRDTVGIPLHYTPGVLDEARERTRGGLTLV